MLAVCAELFALPQLASSRPLAVTTSDADKNFFQFIKNSLLEARSTFQKKTKIPACYGLAGGLVKEIK
ncbi:hypothetical protein FD50_GL001653 [Liquorilactobacillus satsumensis DSM 16230 = JCM 12392]|uniref:Uncharacterized protein n=1 Tax=Liquorilactobacillus satsumensis DSM 16230 = JCM 12392 TaxID=1423801 RepID=A0A0R1UVR0_9LACO|nr:hypothetical protein FD50_GL001653 [Liquorilactobacillus satsumensis DSM 16230 = JCM 12392]